MKLYSIVITTSVSIFTLMQTTLFDQSIWQVLDKYGYPTAMLALAIWFIWNRQKKADGDRNDLISRNNELTRELITAVRTANACNFIESCKFREKENNDG